MILLSLSSAAKYIFTFLLAVLGIISFDEVELPAENRVPQVQATDIRSATPLVRMESIPFSVDMLQPTHPLPEPAYAAIEERSIFPVPCFPAVECQVVVAGQDRDCNYILEVHNLESTAEKVILMYADELETLVVKEVRTLAPGK